MAEKWAKAWVCALKNYFVWLENQFLLDFKQNLQVIELARKTRRI
jgi:hypothetical protein